MCARRTGDLVRLSDMIKDRSEGLVLENYYVQDVSVPCPPSWRLRACIKGCHAAEKDLL